MGNSVKYHKVTFLPEGKTIQVEHLLTVFETIREENPQDIQLHFACASEGICQKCKIRSFKKMGPYTPTEKGCLSDEEIAKGIRLACQARVIQDSNVEIIYKWPFTILSEDRTVSADMNARLEKYYIEAVDGKPLTAEKFPDYIKSISLENMDLIMLLDDIEQKQDKITGFFERNMASGCTAVFADSEIVCLEKGNTVAVSYAVAVDIGVNTLVVSLVDINKGKSVAIVSDTNPQIEMGVDLQSRMNASEEDMANLESLNEELVLRIDILITELCRWHNISPLNVYEIIIGGTTCLLSWLINGIPELNEHRSCFETGKKVNFLAHLAEIRSSSRSQVYFLPVISPVAGSDVTSSMLAAGMNRTDKTVLFLDLGTVISAALSHDGRIVATTTPDSGAFECANISFGMRPVAGAVCGVRIDDEINFRIVADSLPRGICGSGFLELAAELKRSGILGSDGRFLTDSCQGRVNHSVLKRIITREDEKTFLLYSDDGEFDTDIYIGEHDISLLLKSKMRVCVIVASLLNYFDLSADSLEKVYVSGAFGRVEEEVFSELGFVPAILKQKTSFIENAAVKGVQMCAADRDLFEVAEKMVRDVVLLPEDKDIATSSNNMNFMSCY